jgi:phosphonate transport system substrate-binding protein
MKAYLLMALLAALPSLPSPAVADTYWVGVTPWQKGQTEDDINRLYIPLLKYLSEGTGQTFKLKPMPSYEGTVEQIAGGEIAVAMLSPEPYVHAKKANPKLEILATELSWNHDKTEKLDSYRSHILVLASRNDLTGIASLEGKTFAFVSEESTSGYVVPSAYMRDHKIVPATYFSKTYLLGSHPSVTDAIAAGSVDAGATWDFNWKQAIAKHGDIFKAIWTSEPIPNLCVVAHPKLAKSLREKLRKLLLDAPSKYLEGLSSVGFVARPDSFYDPVRKLKK